MNQSQAEPCILYKLDNMHGHAFIVSITFDACATTWLDATEEHSMWDLKRRFMIICEGMLKNHLGFGRKWEVRDDCKMICEINVKKKWRYRQSNVNHVSEDKLRFMNRLEIDISTFRRMKFIPLMQKLMCLYSFELCFSLLSLDQS